MKKRNRSINFKAITRVKNLLLNRKTERLLNLGVNKEIKSEIYYVTQFLESGMLGVLVTFNDQYEII